MERASEANAGKAGPEIRVENVSLRYETRGGTVEALADCSLTVAGGSFACLVGPSGTVTLAAGDYVVWVQVNHSPELTALIAGPMKVV